VETILAKVLSNRKPPYSIYGGLYDALKDSNGEVLLVSNDEATAAAKLFEETEGIDIHIAASVAVASLINTLQENRIDKEAIVMLNITGGGEKRFASETKKLYTIEPYLKFKINPDPDDVKEKLKGLFK